MRIYSLSKVLAIPVGLFGAYVLYTIFFSDTTLPLWLVLIPAIIGVALMLFNVHIDHWYLERNPLPIDPKIKAWLDEHDHYYQQLNPDDKGKFEHRLQLYEHARSFEAVVHQGTNSVPYDLSCFISAQAIKLTMNKKDYLMGDMDRIYLYKHPFPSPRHKFLHTVETQIEDGVIIFALDHLIPGLTHGKQFYNICMHGYAEAYTKVYPNTSWPEEGLSWSAVEAMSGFTKDQILQVLGYPSVDLLPIYITYYFTFPDKVKTHAPGVFQELDTIFS